MFESGIRTQHLKWAIQYVQAANRKATSNSGNEFRPLTLPQSYGIFILLNAGLIFGSLVFVLEVLWYWLKLLKQKICHHRVKKGIRAKTKLVRVKKNKK